MNEETAEPEPEADETGGNADKKREKRRAATEGKSDGAEEKRDGIQEEESDGGEERHRLSEESDFCSFILFVSFLFIPAPKKKKKKKKNLFKKIFGGKFEMALLLSPPKFLGILFRHFFLNSNN